MIIKKLYTLNLEELYKACCLKQDAKSKDSKFAFGSNLISLYNHIELTYILTDVSLYEYMLLKRYSSTCSKLHNKTILYKSPDYNAELHDYSALIHEITTDNSIVNTPIKYNYPYLYGPAFLVRGDCSVTLTGRELISIFDIDPATTFITATKGKCFDRTNNQNSILFNRDYDINDIEISNFLQEKFAKSFYNNFFISSTTGNDIVSDSAIHYYMTTHNEQIQLSSISNPVFKYNIKRDGLDKSTNLISSLKNNKDEIISSCVDIKYVVETTSIIFNIYSRFCTYIDLLENLPKEFFISAEDLKIPSNFREIYIPIEFYEKYSTRLEEAYDNINMYIENEHRNFYVKYQCTYLNSMYAYSIKIKLDDVNRYINTINRNRLLPESKDIINNIIKYSRAVFNLFK